MQTQLAPQWMGTREGAEAQELLRRCVHCGFCTATCPTYQVLGDELDGPRGRIYLIKQVLEGETPTRATQKHLDRCLTCRSCETTCPSGVEYAHLLEIGRKVIDKAVGRPAPERAMRWALRSGLTSPAFGWALKIGRLLRPVLPSSLRQKIPPLQSGGAQTAPSAKHSRRMLVLEGCVQPALMPQINRATRRVLAAAGIETVAAKRSGCCGAIRLHLGDEPGGLADLRRNIDAWWPYIESSGVEAIVVNASGCSVTVKDYGRLLARDQRYAAKARRVSELACDLGELLPDMIASIKTLRPLSERMVFHPPCTLQHGQQLGAAVFENLRVLGLRVELPLAEGHLCCGSAGTYSITQPALSRHLRDRKLHNIEPLAPELIVSANIGCILHLQAGTSTPVKHWIEVLDSAL